LVVLTVCEPAAHRGRACSVGSRSRRFRRPS